MGVFKWNKYGFIGSILLFSFFSLFKYASSLFLSSPFIFFWVILVYICGATLLIGSFIYLYYGYYMKYFVGLFRYWIPFIIAMCTILLILFVPLDQIYRQKNFDKYLKPRNELIQKILNKEVLRNECGLVALPEGYEKLSINHKILISNDDDGLVILFFEWDGFNTVGGYGQKIDDRVFCLGNKANLKEIKKIKDDWYFYKN